MIAEHYIREVLRESSTLNHLQSRVSGLDHWFRVWKNAQILAQSTSGVDMEVVAIFALFHDSMQVDEHDDPDHGMRGWFLWEYLYDGSGHIFSPNRDRLVAEACEDHSKGYTHPDPTIGVCWDADRLDLHRKGIWPDPRFMSTGAGRLLALGRVNPRV